MILSFSRKIGGKATYFAEKIYRAMLWSKEEISAFAETMGEKHRAIGFDKDYSFECKPKLHTIREDKANRWEAGKLIHPYYGARTKGAVQFGPVMRVESVQSIVMIQRADRLDVSIDEKIIYSDELEILAENDGFDTLADFLEYFNGGFRGKIIHWTRLRYPVLPRDERHVCYWIENEVLRQTYKTIRGNRWNECYKVPGWPDWDDIMLLPKQKLLKLLRYIVLCKKTGSHETHED